MSNQNTDPAVGELPIRLKRLATLNRLGSIGVDGVTERLSNLGEEPTEVVVDGARAGFVTRDGLGRAFSDERRIGVRVRIGTTSVGYLLVLFDMKSVNRAAALMLSNAVDDLDEAPNELAHSAVAELGGIIANGFADAIADAVDQEIDVKTPSRIDGAEQELVARTFRVGEALGLYIFSRLHIPEHDFETTVYLFPDSQAMIRALRGMDHEVTDT